jgi:hypothetical protein
MSSNRLKGTIDPEWKADNLKELVLSQNAFSGSLPDGICRMFRLGEKLLFDYFSPPFIDINKHAMFTLYRELIA